MPDFLDSNVLVYAYRTGDPRKTKIAQQCLEQAVLGAFLISTQVLAEFASTLLHKSPAPAPYAKVLLLLDQLSPIRTVSPDLETVRRAVQASESYGIHFYDGMIVAAAQGAGCKRILSEDLNHGQSYFGVQVENPFL